MIYDKACGNVRLTVTSAEPEMGIPAFASISTPLNNREIALLTLEDLRDLRHLIDAALRAAK